MAHSDGWDEAVMMKALVSSDLPTVIDLVKSANTIDAKKMRQLSSQFRREGIDLKALPAQMLSQFQHVIQCIYRSGFVKDAISLSFTLLPPTEAVSFTSSVLKEIASRLGNPLSSEVASSDVSTTPGLIDEADQAIELDSNHASAYFDSASSTGVRMPKALAGNTLATAAPSMSKLNPVKVLTFILKTVNGHSSLFCHVDSSVNSEFNESLAACLESLNTESLLIHLGYLQQFLQQLNEQRDGTVSVSACLLPKMRAEITHYLGSQSSKHPLHEILRICLTAFQWLRSDVQSTLVEGFLTTGQEAVARLCLAEFQLWHGFPQLHLSKCSLEGEKVIIVSSELDFRAAMQELKTSDVIGLDQEQEPNISPGGFSSVSILQLATRQAIFLLDMQTLGELGLLSSLLPLLGEVLRGPNIKLGVGFGNDLRNLARSYPHEALTQVNNLLESAKLFYYSLGEKQGHGRPISLKKLVCYFLNKNLAKTEQMSNWARRPLTSSQIEYAALDALALVHIYDVFQTSCPGANISHMLQSVTISEGAATTKDSKKPIKGNTIKRHSAGAQLKEPQ